MTQQKWGYDAPDLKELVEWADIVDGALYNNAKEAVELVAPAMKLTLLIEGTKGSDMVQRIIRAMRRQPLSHIIKQPDVEAVYRPLYERHVESIDIIRRVSNHDRGVVYFDLVDEGLESYNKFIPYFLHPDSTYTVSVSTSPFRTKVSVGSNPWSKRPVTHNLATICERYGGGGHAKVGAISFPIGEIARARDAASEISEELKA